MDYGSAVAELLYQLDFASSNKRVEAMEKLEGRPRTIQLAGARLGASDPNVSIRILSADILAKLGNRSDRFRVVRLLEDPEWVVRSSAVNAVTQVLKASAYKHLATALVDAHYIVRRDSAIALGDLGLAKAIDVLENRLVIEQNDQARTGILWALTVLGERQYLSQLVSMHGSSFKGVQVILWRMIEELISHQSLTLEEASFISRSARTASSERNSPALEEVLHSLLGRLNPTVNF